MRGAPRREFEAVKPPRRPLALAVGYTLVDHGLIESFLRSMGMEYEDLFYSRCRT